jgi:copper chaperone CopZ
MRSQIVTALALLCASSLCFAADTSVTLSDVHVCCGNCVKNADATAAKVTGAKAVADQSARTIVVTAPDAATAQKAVNALIGAGFYGKSSDAAIKVDAPSNAPAGKVQKLEVAGVHLCCPKCVTVVKDILSKVPGVTSNTAAAKAETFTITGDFEPKVVFEELNKAGMAGHVAPAAK